MLRWAFPARALPQVWTKVLPSLTWARFGLSATAKSYSLFRPFFVYRPASIFGGVGLCELQAVRSNLETAGTRSAAAARCCGMRGLWKLDLLRLPHAVLRRIILRLLLCLPCSASRSTSPAWNAKRSERRLVRIYSPEGRVLNRAPHSGHSISSKLTRLISAG